MGEVRHLFAKYGGNLGETGSVGWMFDKKGYLVVERKDAPEETLLEIVLEAGGEDVKEDESNWEIYTPPESVRSRSRRTQSQSDSHRRGGARE